MVVCDFLAQLVEHDGQERYHAAEDDYNDYQNQNRHDISFNAHRLNLAFAMSVKKNAEIAIRQSREKISLLTMSMMQTLAMYFIP
jgi:hypothetical protein